MCVRIHVSCTQSHMYHYAAHVYCYVALCVHIPEARHTHVSDYATHNVSSCSLMDAHLHTATHNPHTCIVMQQTHVPTCSLVCIHIHVALCLHPYMYCPCLHICLLIHRTHVYQLQIQNQLF